MGNTVLSTCALSGNSSCGAEGAIDVGNDGDGVWSYSDDYDAFAWHIRG